MAAHPPPTIVPQVADANNDRLMAGTACIKFPKLLEMGAEGPFILQRYKDLYREAQVGRGG